jgi:hypothetical protein
LFTGLPDSNTSFRIKAARVSPDGASVTLDGMKASIRVAMGQPGSFSYQDLGLDADVDVKAGQKVVVGRLSLHDQALFLVLMAHVVN